MKNRHEILNDFWYHPKDGTFVFVEPQVPELSTHIRVALANELVPRGTINVYEKMMDAGWIRVKWGMSFGSRKRVLHIQANDLRMIRKMMKLMLDKVPDLDYLYLMYHLENDTQDYDTIDPNNMDAFIRRGVVKRDRLSERSPDDLKEVMDSHLIDNEYIRANMRKAQTLEGVLNNVVKYTSSHLEHIAYWYHPKKKVFWYSVNQRVHHSNMANVIDPDIPEVFDIVDFDVLHEMYDEGWVRVRVNQSREGLFEFIICHKYMKAVHEHFKQLYREMGSNRIEKIQVEAEFDGKYGTYSGKNQLRKFYYQGYYDPTGVELYKESTFLANLFETVF
tara:strand:- start:574 stop:1575 length:1002 start_codon:yes stop_codon:yes gene_type:complete